MKIWAFPGEAADKRLSVITRRGLGFRKKDLQAVGRILEDVRKSGDDALIRYARRFDSPNMDASQMRVGKEEMRAALHRVDGKFKRSLRRAHRQISDFYLLGLAVKNKGLLATFDRRITAQIPKDSPHFNTVTFIPMEA